MSTVLVVASAGGHWIQLRRLDPLFNTFDVIYVSTNSSLRNSVSKPFYCVTDCNQWERIRAIRCFFEMFFILLRTRPDVIISTGAAPGFFAILIGKMFGAKTIWIDSIANAEMLSGSGMLAGRWADLWLTQWEHLARPDGPQYWGSVL